LNPYLNYHRPCAQADIEVEEKGRQQRRYRRYQTPLETLPGAPGSPFFWANLGSPG